MKRNLAYKRTISAIFGEFLWQVPRPKTLTEAGIWQVHRLWHCGRSRVQARGRVYISLTSYWRRNSWRHIKERNGSFFGDCSSLRTLIGKVRYRECGWRVSGLHWLWSLCSSLCGCASNLILLPFSLQILLKLSLVSVKLFWGVKLWAMIDRFQPIWGYIPCSHIRHSLK